MNIITVAIPVSHYHIDALPTALASVRAQTLPCDVAIYYDEHGKGAGYARNRLLEQIRTPLVIFLDADDLLKPTFAERTYALYQQTGRYVYTDWDDDTGKRYSAPDCAWSNGSYHLITTLLPSEWVRAVGGFDEQLPAGEDSDFYTHLVTEGYCGVHLPETLVTYTHLGKRSQTWFKSEQFARVKHQIEERYRGKRMGCCDGQPLSPIAPEGERVLIMPTWGLGTRTVIGQATGTHYGRLDASTPPVLMDRRDAALRPDLYRVIEPPKAAAPDKANDSEAHSFKALAGRLRDQWDAPIVPEKPAPFVAAPADPVEVRPDVERVLRLTGAPAVHVKRDPVFVFPEKDYPSYTDARRLVELSGFESVAFSQAEAKFADTYIYLSPEQPPQNLWGSRHIWWSLEYGGEYEPDLSRWRGEIWASDPAWAAAHNAKMVVMGSHENLAEWNRGFGMTKKYDATMLAYMTPRRQALKDELFDLNMPEIIYPGYGLDRAEQLVNSRLMLHAHQELDRYAIAPQRFALCAAYRLPLIHESVALEGDYAGAAIFAPYDLLAQTTRAALNERDLQVRGDALHDWLTKDLTFRKSVEEALRD